MCIKTVLVANILCTSLIWNHFSFLSLMFYIFLKFLLQSMSVFNLPSHFFTTLRFIFTLCKHFIIQAWAFLLTVNNLKPAGFIFIRGVSLTHPVLASLLYGKFLLHSPCWLYVSVGSFSYTSHAGFFYFNIGSFSYTSRTGFSFIWGFS